MNSLRKYFLSAFAAIALSLVLANVTAMAYCAPQELTEEYSCFNTGEDEYQCYYECFCNGSEAECDLVLFRGGYPKAIE